MVPPRGSTSVPPGVYPPLDFPVIFADGVASLANSPVIVKFYLYRYDPEFAGGGQTKTQLTHQIVMPMDAFAATFTFFEAAVKKFVSQGSIAEARLEELRKIQATIAWKT